MYERHHQCYFYINDHGFFLRGHTVFPNTCLTSKLYCYDSVASVPIKFTTFP